MRMVLAESAGPTDVRMEIDMTEIRGPLEPITTDIFPHLSCLLALSGHAVSPHGGPHQPGFFLCDLWIHQDE